MDLQPLFEQLETRVVLQGSPFPALELLEDPSNTVVRFSTDLGDIDIEVLADMSTTAASFLNLLRSGAYGDTIVHRAEPGFVVGTGLYRYDDQQGLTQREGTVPVIGAVLRSNTEGTLAMAVPELTAFESSGEFIFNLADNPGLDGNWLVFARVVQGWDVVQQIAGLPTSDLSTVITGPGAEELTSVPLREPEPPQITEDLFIRLGDVQIIKPAGTEAFYTFRIYYPEGYSWERIVESLHVVNPNLDEVGYQVLVRYETGQRDQVIAERLLAAQGRESITISPELRESDLVRDHAPFAYEIWSTLPVAADLHHRDFGRPTRESFFNPEALPGPSLMHEWTFTQAAFGFGASNVFIVWQNTTAEPTTVTVTFYFQDAEPMSMAFDLGAHRRGGLNLRDVQGLPPAEDFLGASVAADAPIVASMSRYDRRAGVSELEGGVMALGTFGGGSTVGIAPAARRGPLDPLAILNTTDQPVVLNFVVTPRPGETQEMEVTVPAGRLTILEGLASPTRLAPPGREYTISYSASAPVTAGFITSAFRGTGTNFATWAASEIHFADASVYVAPQGAPFGLSAVSIYNPSSTADIILTFRFNTPPPVQTLPSTWMIAMGQTQERRINSFNQIIGQARGGVSDLTARAPYSLEVLSNIPVVAQTRLLQGEGRTELGMPLTPIVLLGSTLV